MKYGTQEFNVAVLKMIMDKNYRHEMYQETVAHAEDMSVHLYGTLPEKILNRMRPREDPAIKQYRLDSWEPFTKSTADKGLTIVAKMFNPSLYSIRWENETKETKQLKEATLIEYEESNSVVNYFAEVGLRKMMADPNGIIAIKPEKEPETELERVSAEIKFYGSKNIWWKDDDCYLIFKSTREEKGITITLFEYFDEEAYVKFEAYTLNTKDLNVIEIESYLHMCDEIPAWELRGTEETKDNGESIFKSFFEPAAAFWNKAINHESDLEGAYIQHMHPLRVEASIECDYIMDGQRCRQGYITAADGVRSMCPSCGGSGVRGMLNSPHGLIRVNVEQFKNESGGSASIAPVSFVSVPTEATEMLENRVDKLLEKGLYALNMDIVNKIGENQSGKAKVIDRGELYDFLYKISSVVFDVHITNIFYFFNLYMFKVEATSMNKDLEKNLPEVSKPVAFDIQSSQELLIEFDTAKKAGTQDSYLKVKQKQINAKEFANDPDLKAMMDLIVNLDPLPELTVDDLIAESQKGWVKQMDLVIHSNIGNFVHRAIQEDKNFSEKKYQEQRLKMEEFAAEVIDANREMLEQVNSPDDSSDTD